MKYALGRRVFTAQQPDYRGRVERLRRLLKKRRCSALLVTDINNIRYLTGFTGSNAQVVLTEKKGLFLTDSRYSTQAASEVREGFRVRVYRKKPLDALAMSLSGLGLSCVGFVETGLSFGSYVKLKKALRPVRLRPLPDLVGEIRAVKEPSEVESIRGAVLVLELAFKKIERVLKPGMTEKEAAFLAEVEMRRRGARGTAFETIVASGPRSALPHGKASEKRIKTGELVVVDMGASVGGYNSDETRTYCTGRVGSEEKKIFRTVVEAHSRAVERIKAGVKASDVDAAARGHIRKAGYGRFFGHGTGHGVGLDIHESPNIGPMSTDVLEEGMVVTVEPGIYVPGLGGVRIEDMVLVTKDGPEILTNSPKELRSL